jgi:eukaryotic-like serine/threonine-protein kinase
MRDTLEHLFHQAIDLPTGERPRFLDTACHGDAQLRAELESLLGCASQGDTGIRGAIHSAAARLVPESGARVGPYRLLEPIGEGGMGVVFLAERADGQYEQQVAIKFVQGGAAAIARFQQEQQILARLRHPNIARLIDGGLTSDGAPYMVMEYFPGEPLGAYCRSRQLSLEDKLRLFLEMCRAVEYAHRSLIIHRDLKPSNILVNAQGELKLLDFGIAKFLHRPAGEQYTAPGCSFFTPDYASPEQIRGEPVTTATDVYSLGAVLFELLRGTGPHRLQTYSPAEITQVVCLDPPPELGLGNELDQIVQMALRKEPERRYASVAQLAEDIERFLANRPVLAKGDSFGYRARKFLRRNALAVAAASLALTSLVGGLGVAVWQAQVARREAEQAQRRFQQVRKLARTVLFDLDDQVRLISGAIGARELLAKTAIEYLDSLYADAKSDPTLPRELAIAYERIADVQGLAASPNLGQPYQAVRNYKRSMELWEGLPEGQRDPLAYPRVLLKIVNEVGGPPLLARARTAAERLQQTAPDAPETYALLVRLERVTANDKVPKLRFEEAVTHLHRARTFAEKWQIQKRDAESLDYLAGVLEGLGRNQLRAGQSQAALESLDRVLAMRRKAWAAEPRNPRLALSMLQILVMRGNTLAHPDYLHLNRPTEAAAAYREAIEIGERIIREDGRNVRARTDLAEAHLGLAAITLSRNPAAAKALQSKALALATEVVKGAPTPGLRADVGRAHLGLAETAYRQRRFAEAAAQLETTLALFHRKVHSPQSRFRELAPLTLLLRVRVDGGNAAEAKEAYKKLKARLATVEADGVSRHTMAGIADAYAAMGGYLRRGDEAMEMYRKSLELWDRLLAEGALPGVIQPRRAKVMRAMAGL